MQKQTGLNRLGFWGLAFSLSLVSCGFKTPPQPVVVNSTLPDLEVYVSKFIGSQFQIYFKPTAASVQYYFLAYKNFPMSKWEQDSPFCYECPSEELLRIEPNGVSSETSIRNFWDSFSSENKKGVLHLELNNFSFTSAYRFYLGYKTFGNRRFEQALVAFPQDNLAKPVLTLEKKVKNGLGNMLYISWQAWQMNPVKIKSLPNRPGPSLILFYSIDSDLPISTLASSNQKTILLTGPLPIYARFQDGWGNLSNISNYIQ